MIELLNKWIMGVTVVSLAVAVAETLVEQEGIRQVLRLAGGILLLVVLLNPVLSLWTGESRDIPEISQQSAEELERAYVALQQEEMAVVIAREASAYISDKAEEMGVSCGAEVEVDQGESGLALPAGVRMNIPYHEELSRWLEEKLEIPAERQIWQEG